MENAIIYFVNYGGIYSPNLTWISHLIQKDHLASLSEKGEIDPQGNLFSLCYSSDRIGTVTLQMCSSAFTDNGAAYTGRLVFMECKVKI